jgi:S1-C subfamily serine protease
MRTRNHTIIRCDSCGQVYHVPSSSKERRAKCRPCGNEFIIPVAVVHAEVRGPRHAAADRYVAAQVATLSSEQAKTDGRSFPKPLAVAGGLLILVLVAFIFIAFNQYSDAARTVQLRRGRVAKSSLPGNQPEYSSVMNLIEAVEPSVVQIEAINGIGSGFVLDKSGLIVTCCHCIQDADYATVVLANGKRLEVLGTAAIAPDCDVAILVVETSDSLVPLELAEVKPRKGEPIVAIGSPGGLSFSQSRGSVSGMRTAEELSELRGEFQNRSSLAPSVALVQITAPVVPGNSGGPVVDFSGNVIGIVSFFRSYYGLTFGFCIDASEIRRVFVARDSRITPLSVRRKSGRPR